MPPLVAKRQLGPARRSLIAGCIAGLLVATLLAWAADAWVTELMGRFVVEPSQFGGTNKEGLLSGAFWFYYRLGFRPIDPR